MRPPHLGPDEVRQNVAVLQCLSRLAGSSEAAEALLESPTSLGRLFACLGCGEDAVAFEAGRVLLRLFAPGAARSGAGMCLGGWVRGWKQQAAHACTHAATRSRTYKAWHRTPFPGGLVACATSAWVQGPRFRWRGCFM